MIAPCPVCGNERVAIDRAYLAGCWHSKCYKCCYAGTMYADQPAVIAAHNRLAAEAQLGREVAAADATLQAEYAQRGGSPDCDAYDEALRAALRRYRAATKETP